MEWKSVVGFEGLYEVSNSGNIRSLDRAVIDNKGKTRALKGKDLKPFISGGGYLQARLSKDGIKYQPYLHKIVAEAFIDNPNDYGEVNHINHNKLDASVANLEWCDRSQNMKYAVDFYRNNKEKGNQYSSIAKTCNCIDCGTQIHVGAVRCVPCDKVKSRVVDRPSKDKLRELLVISNFKAVGTMFGVSDNAVRKWCKFYGMSTKSSDYKLKKEG